MNFFILGLPPAPNVSFVTGSNPNLDGLRASAASQLRQRGKGWYGVNQMTTTSRGCWDVRGARTMLRQPKALAPCDPFAMEARPQNVSVP